MLSSRQQLLADAYARQLAGLRASVERGVAARYVDLDPADLDVAFGRFVDEAEPLIRAGQATAATLAAAYLRALFAIQAGRTIEIAPAPDDVVGRTENGVSLRDGMAAWPAMVKQRIARGAPLAEALDHGRYLAQRFADSEVTRAADRTAEGIARATPEVAGWRGVVAAGACSPCQANAGDHGLDVPVYRHGSCHCQVGFFVA